MPVAELIARMALAHVLPVSKGGLSLVETDLGHLTCIAPFKGRTAATSKALQSALGIDFPAPNRMTGDTAAGAIWFGRDMALLVGPALPSELTAMASITDQSDAWGAVTLSGPGSEDVLARLVPVDLRHAHFAVGHTARSLLGHMNASVTRTAADSFLILVFRSMAETLAHEMQEAMEAVAARG